MATGQGLPNRGGAWRRQPGDQLTISEITGNCAKKCSSQYCCRAHCSFWKGKCDCGNAEGHPELAVMVEEERQRRRKIEFLHLEDTSS